MDTRFKQTSESRLYNMDFAALLQTGETIDEVVSVVVDKTGLTIGTPSISGSKVQFRISGGADRQSYKVTVIIQTSLDNTLEGEGVLTVRDY